jgi:hypothetical protein
MTSPSPKPVDPESVVLVMQDLRSVLPVRVFVQMAAMVQTKFKLSVACGMHLPRERSQTGTSCNAASGRYRYLPLTPGNVAGFNLVRVGGRDG